MNLATRSDSSFIIHHSSLLPLFLKQRLQVAVDGGGDEFGALDDGVDAVFLVEFVDAGDAFEEEGDERDVVLGGERLEGVADLDLVVAAGVGGRQHPGKKNLRVVRPGAL